MRDRLSENLIRISNPDVPIYRIFQLPWFRRVLEDRELALVSPHLWDDPFENFLSMCAITHTAQPDCPQEFFDRIRKPLYSQCWSMVDESDTLWRAYSWVVKDATTGRNKFAEYEGVQVRTTPRKLLRQLWDWCADDPQESCFLGRVRYMPQEAVKQYIADEIGKGGLQAFPGGRGHAESILFKQSAFNCEAEARLIYVEHSPKRLAVDHLAIPVNPSLVFDEVIFDPRLAPFQRNEREQQCRDTGFSGSIRSSQLYQKTLLEVVVP